MSAARSSGGTGCPAGGRTGAGEIRVFTKGSALFIIIKEK